MREKMPFFGYKLLFVTFIVTIVESAYFQHPTPLVTRSCCNNSKRRGMMFQEPRAPTLEELLAIAEDNNQRTIVLQAENDPLAEANEKLRLSEPPPFVIDDADVKNMENQKAYLCSKIQCDGSKYTTGPVCACNFNTGRVVTFKNKCDLTKHNCRFNTGFKVILNDICPWEFESRRRDPGERKFDYTDPKYYN